MELIDKINDIVTAIQVDDLPIFRYGELVETEDTMALMNRVVTLQPKKMPLVYMNTEFDQTETIRGREYEAEITLWIINRSDPKLNAEQRHINELPILRIIRDDLLKELRRFCELTSVRTREIFLNKNHPDFQSPVNIIRLTVGMRYELIC